MEKLTKRQEFLGCVAVGERRDILERVGKALIDAAGIGAGIERGDGWGNVSGEITKLDADAGMVEIELNSMGPSTRKLRFNLAPSAGVMLGLKKDVILEEFK